MTTEAEHVAASKGYEGPYDDMAQREVDSYFDIFAGRDNPANRDIVLKMNEDIPQVHERMQKLFAEYDNSQQPQPRVDYNMDDMSSGDPNAVAPGYKPPLATPDYPATAAEKGSGQVPEPRVVSKPLTPVSPGDPTDTSALALGQAAKDIRTGYGEGVSSRKEQEKAETRGEGDPGGSAEEDISNTSAESPGGGGALRLPPRVHNLRSSQSQNQGLVEPPEARTLSDYAAAEQTQAADEEAFLASITADRMMEISNKRTREMNAQIRAEQIFADKQARIAADSERRIAAAEQALKEAEVDPNFNPMREIMEGGDWGKKLSFVAGMLGGSIGAQAQTNATGIYHTNKFLESFEKAVDRKIDLMEKRYRARKDYLGAAQDGYARMRQILQDEQATRAMIQAKAWQMFELETDRVMIQHGADMQGPGLRKMMADIALKKRDRIMESARTTTQVSAQREELAHDQVVQAAGAGDEDKALADISDAYLQQEMPALEAGLNLVQTALDEYVKDPTLRSQIAINLQAGRWGDFGRTWSSAVADNDQVYQNISAAMMQYAQAFTGKAETKGEMLKAAALVGDGKPEGIAAFYRIIDNQRRVKETTIAARNPAAWRKFKANKQQVSGRESNYHPRTMPAGSKPEDAKK